MVARRSEITVVEAAEILGVTPGRVHQFLLDGRLRVARRLGRVGGTGLILLRRAEVERFGRRPRPPGNPTFGGKKSP